MKKKLLNIFIMSALSVIWLFPFQMSGREGIMLSGFAATIICLYLIPQKYVAFIFAAVITVGMSVYAPEYTAGFAPSVFFTTLLIAAILSKPAVPIKKDGFLCLTLTFELAAVVYSIFYTFISMRETSFSLNSFERYHAYVIVALVLASFTVYRAKSADKKKNSGQQNKKDHLYGKLAAVYFALTLCIAAAALFFLKQGPLFRLYSLPVFISVYSAFALPEPKTVMSLLAGKAE